jgi:hypothetical protein
VHEEAMLGRLVQKAVERGEALLGAGDLAG